MATLLDTGLLEFILPVFSILLIYAIIFAILQKVKIFGESTATNIMVAVALAVIFAITPGAMEFVRLIAPWFVVMVFVAFSFILIFMFFGAKEEKIALLAQNAVIQWTVIIIWGIIVIAALTKVFGPLFGQPSATPGVGGEVERTLFNPKVLATIFILLVASQAVKFISSGAGKS